MKHVKCICDSLEAVRIAILVGFAAMCFSAMASDCGLQGMERDTTQREEFFCVHETAPQFPGGDMALMKYLQENVS